MCCPTGGVVSLYLTQGSEPLVCGAPQGCSRSSTDLPCRLGFPNSTPAACCLQGVRTGVGDLEVFHFRAVFSCRLQSLFA